MSGGAAAAAAAAILAAAAKVPREKAAAAVAGELGELSEGRVSGEAMTSLADRGWT